MMLCEISQQTYRRLFTATEGVTAANSWELYRVALCGLLMEHYLAAFNNTYPGSFLVTRLIIHKISHNRRKLVKLCLCMVRRQGKLSDIMLEEFKKLVQFEIT